MNNDEKMLSILESLVVKVSAIEQGQARLTEDVSGLKGDVSGLKDDVSGLKGDVSSLADDVSALKDDVSAIKVKIENVIEKNIQILAEGHAVLNRKLDYVIPIVEKLEEDVDVIKLAVSSNSADINRLKSAV